MGKMCMLCICFCCLSGLLAVLFWNSRHPPGGMKGKGLGWLRYFYPTAYLLHRFIRMRLLPAYPEEKIKRLQKTDTGKTREELEEYYDCQRIGGCLLLFMVTLGIVFLSILSEDRQAALKNAYILERGEPGMGDTQVELKVKAEEERREVPVTVPERLYRQEELEEKFAEAEAYIKKQYLGENVSSEDVTEQLLLVTQIPGSQIGIRWRLDSNGYVNRDGSLNYEMIQQKTEVTLTAVLTYGEEKRKVPLSCILCPRERTQQEVFWDQWQQAVEKQKKKTAQDSLFSLPKKVAGKRISYEEVGHAAWPRILLAGLVLCMMLPALLDYQTEQKVVKRERELQKEYPEMVERCILLISAGLTIRGAWYRITDDYQKCRQKDGHQVSYLYEEMLITRRDMDNGQNEAAAYAAFGRRLSLLPYMKFSTLLVQNLKKGSDDLLKRMDMEAVDAMRERREMAKKLGEEAGTKLIFPMMIMLVIVFAMILMAAFQNM